MKRNLIFWIVATSLVGIFSFYIGGVWGFSTGFANSIGATAPSDANLIAQILRRLDDNKNEAATFLLETHLDTKILEHYIVIGKGTQSIFNVLEPARSYYDKDSASFKLMKDVSKYRSNKGSQNKNDEIRRMIEEAVQYYTDKGRTQK